MMTLNLKKIMLMIAMVTTVTISQANADEYSRIDRDARRIERKTDQLLRETKHYRNTSNYQVMVDSCIQLKNLASHFHDVAHYRGELSHLKQDIAQLHTYLHLTEELFDETENNAAYGHGCIKGNTRHVKKLIEYIDKCIVRMERDLHSLCEVRVAYRPVVAPPRPVITPPQVYEVRRTEFRIPLYDAPRSPNWDRSFYGSRGLYGDYDLDRGLDRGRGFGSDCSLNRYR